MGGKKGRTKKGTLRRKEGKNQGKEWKDLRKEGEGED